MLRAVYKTSNFEEAVYACWLNLWLSIPILWLALILPGGEPYIEKDGYIYLGT